MVETNMHPNFCLHGLPLTYIYMPVLFYSAEIYLKTQIIFFLNFFYVFIQTTDSLLVYKICMWYVFPIQYTNSIKSRLNYFIVFCKPSRSFSKIFSHTWETVENEKLMEPDLLLRRILAVQVEKRRPNLSDALLELTLFRCI
jgi:hypothetical protein